MPFIAPVLVMNEDDKKSVKCVQLKKFFVGSFIPAKKVKRDSQDKGHGMLMMWSRKEREKNLSFGKRDGDKNCFFYLR
jgi:hypothetical protein